MKYILFSMMMALSSPLLAATDFDPKQDVTNGVSVSFVQQDLSTRHPVYIKQLKSEPEKRDDYVRKLYYAAQLEKAVGEKDLAENQAVLEALRTARQKILLDALVVDELERANNDIFALARDRYEADREQYKTPRKIKIAVIFMRKNEGEEEQIKQKMDEILEQLRNESPANFQMFSDLAKQYSQDRFAAKGGYNDKWLVAPANVKGSSPLVQAAFGLKTLGQLSDVVENSQGYTIFKLMHAKPSEPLSFDDVKDDIMEAIKQELWTIKKAEIEKSLLPIDDLKGNDELLEALVNEESKKRQ